ncbi:MAG: hypothetical protein ACXVA9_14375, partial [Bdellovibrionales bacterium]
AEKFTPLSKAECVESDFSARMGPIGDRGEGNFCHIFTAADLINVNQGLEGDRRISRLDLASNLSVIDFAEIMRELPEAKTIKELFRRQSIQDVMKETVMSGYPKYMWGGVPDVDIMAINHRDGVCTEKELPSQQSRLFNHHGLYVYQKFNEVEREREDTFSLWLKQCQTQNTMGNFADFAMQLGKLSAQQADARLVEPCKEKIHLKPMTAHVIVLGDTEGSRQAMSFLKRGIPVSIGYDHAVNHGLVGRESDHAVTVAGAQWNKATKTCEFKIRESNGTDCSNVAKKWNCKDGEFWFPDNVFAAATTHLFYIDPQVMQTSESIN